MNWLVLGDSLTYHKFTAGQELGDAWPLLLHRRVAGLMVWQRARRGATTRDVIKELKALIASIGAKRSFEAMIIQIGIVDSCLRPVPQWVYKFLSSFEAGLRLCRWINANYPLLLRYYSRPWISIGEFERNLRKAVELGETLADQVVLVAISPPHFKLVRDVPRIEEQIRRYNQVIELVAASMKRPNVRVLNPYAGAEALEDWFLEDGYHLTKRGHEAFAAALMPILAPPALENACGV